MNEEQKKLIKKYNRVYVIELFVIAAVVVVLGTLKITGVINTSQTSRRIFNIITIIGSTFIVLDFIWLCFSKAKQKRNCWLDKISVLPISIALITYDIICFINWDVETLSYSNLFVAIVLYYVAAVYTIQALYHLKKPHPSMVTAAMEEYRERHKDDKVLELVKKILGEGSSIEAPLTGGMMNISYIVKDKDGKKYVLYISTVQANEMVNRPLEKEHQKIVYDLGITSRNVYFDAENGIKINEYIEGSSIDKVNEFDYDKLAELFKKLHSSKKLSKLDYQPFQRFEQIYEKEAKEFSKNIDPKYQKLRDFLFENRDYLESQKKVFSHNDAQRSNIVIDNNDNYFFIDFEFVGNNDEIYDIATFGNRVVAEGRELLNHYFTNPSQDEIKRYYLWRIYISLQWYNVAIVKHYRGEGRAHGFNFLKVADHFLSNANDAYNGYQSEIK